MGKVGRQVEGLLLRILRLPPVRRLRRHAVKSTPRHVRFLAIREMLRAELDASPRESVRWLLGIHDHVGLVIDNQCIRWGDGVHIKHSLMDGIHSFFYERIPAGAHVLDVGCGIGALAYSIVTHTEAHVVGVDINESRIAFARGRFKHPKLWFEVGDVTNSQAAHRVDVVVLSSVLEHLPTRVEFLRTLADRFQPDQFLIRVPTFQRHHFAALKRELGLFPYTDPGHLLEYTPGSFAAEMDRAGLDIRYMEVRWGDVWAECVPRCADVEMDC